MGSDIAVYDFLMLETHMISLYEMKYSINEIRHVATVLKGGYSVSTTRSLRVEIALHLENMNKETLLILYKIKK